MTLYGPDISSWQAGLDAGAVPGDFVIIKATGGTGYVNPTCDAQYQAAKAAGKLLAVYHYAHEQGFQGSAVDEARFFLANVRGYIGEAILVLDWESDNVTDSNWALEFKRVVESEGGVRLMVYGSVSQLEYLRPCHDLDSPVWAAAYTLGYQPINGYAPPVGPIGLPDGFSISMWQFTSQGHVAGWGSPIDLNVFYGDADAWRKLAAPLAGAVAPQGEVTGPVVQAPTPPPAPAPAPAAPAVPVAPGPGQCRVDPGDTLSGIAAQFGVSLWALEAANPGINYDLIYPGQILNLPQAAPAPAPSGLPPYCTVDPGDTLSLIAAQYGISLAALEAANPGINYDLIFPGQRINLP